MIPNTLNDEMSLVNKQRIYNVDLFRRNSWAKFEFIVDNIKIQDPLPVIDAKHKNIQVVPASDEQKKKLTDLIWMASIGTLIYLLSLYEIYLYCKTVPSVILWTTITGILSGLLSWALYKLGLHTYRYLFN